MDKSKSTNRLDKSDQPIPDKNTVNKQDKNTLPKKPLPSLPTELLKLTGFLDSWKDWLIHKKEIKSKVTPLSATKQLNMLLKQPDPVATINHAIEKGWKGFYPIPKSNTGLHYHDLKLMDKLAEIGFKGDRQTKAYAQAKEWKLDWKVINRNNYAELASAIKGAK